MNPSIIVSKAEDASVILFAHLDHPACSLLIARSSQQRTEFAGAVVRLQSWPWGLAYCGRSRPPPAPGETPIRFTFFSKSCDVRIAYLDEPPSHALPPVAIHR